MPLRRLIASGLLLAVFLAPALGLALCNQLASTAKSGCSHCAMVSHSNGSNHSGGSTAARQHGTAPQLPLAPCCQRKASVPALGESAAQIVAPVQIALLPAHSPVAGQSSLPALRVEKLISPPAIVSSLSLLCTLRI